MITNYLEMPNYVALLMALLLLMVQQEAFLTFSFAFQMQPSSSCIHQRYLPRNFQSKTTLFAQPNRQNFEKRRGGKQYKSNHQPRLNTRDLVEQIESSFNYQIQQKMNSCQ